MHVMKAWVGGGKGGRSARDRALSEATAALGPEGSRWDGTGSGRSLCIGASSNARPESEEQSLSSATLVVELSY